MLANQLASGRRPAQNAAVTPGRIRPTMALLGTALLLGAAAVPAFGQASRLANPASLSEQAPASYKAKLDTTKGVVVIEVRRDWAPNGADRFYNLVKNGFYDDVRFFRVVSGFMVQFGINGDPKISASWRNARIKDDPVKQSNKRGTVTFATSGPDSRTSQVFINFADNSPLDAQGFSPFGQVTAGMNVVDALHGGYGEGAPRGRGPDQGRIQGEGNAYLTKDFPNLDYVKKATIEK
jgi:peptidyl-prolyl cis-trans isomerase A (cyclophilin A)